SRVSWTVAAIVTALAYAIATASTVNYEYDNAGRLVAVLDAIGNGSSYSYDHVGNILSITTVSPTTVSVFSLSPTSGPVGTQVIINGDGFSSIPSQNTVTFNGQAASVSASTLLSITTSVPVGATTGEVRVTAPNGSAANHPIFTVTP